MTQYKHTKTTSRKYTFKCQLSVTILIYPEFNFKSTITVSH